VRNVDSTNVTETFLNSKIGLLMQLIWKTLFRTFAAICYIFSTK